MSMLLWTRRAPPGVLLVQHEDGGVLAEPLCCQSTAIPDTRQQIGWGHNVQTHRVYYWKVKQCPAVAAAATRVC